jgi:aminoglycoside phosphotransferase family enzyme
MLVARLAEGRLRAGMIEALARRLAEFHADAPGGAEVAQHAHPDALDRQWRENLDESLYSRQCGG